MPKERLRMHMASLCWTVRWAYTGLMTPVLRLSMAWRLRASSWHGGPQILSSLLVASNTKQISNASLFSAVLAC
ncbi:hypothetical protein BGZ63DRAFT_257573 [Mariannaea sp. PMI_226]|nr:hypothetical protein BGZ63DRAFT_257573 [Mariannaea sp. PMI_226]